MPKVDKPVDINNYIFWFAFKVVGTAVVILIGALLVDILM